MIPLKAEVIHTDVLVIGGGGAGSTAALKAKQLGAEVLMIVKGTLGQSGCSVFAGTLAYGVPKGLPPFPILAFLRKLYRLLPLPLPKRYEHGAGGYLGFRGIIDHYMYYLIDQDYVIDALLWALSEWYPTLEASGLYFPRDAEGELVVDPYGSSMAAYQYGFNGFAFMDLKRKEILSKGIRVLEETSAVSLLTNKGECVGAVALNYAKGELYIIASKSTILATGASNWLATRSTGTREQAANGVALASRIGAPLYNLEIQWWHVSDMAYPRSWMRLHNYPNRLLNVKGQLRHLNAAGEVFFDAGETGKVINVPYAVQLKHLYQQVKEGKARWDGGYYSSYTHIDQERLKEYLYHYQFYQSLGLDPGKDVLESAITWHYTHGGVFSDHRTLETRVPGLFVAGGVAGHQGLALVCYDGHLAGVQAVRRARRIRKPEVDMGQTKEMTERLNGYLRSASSKNGVTPAKVKNRIRGIMWKRCGFVKTEENLKAGLKELSAVSEEMVGQMRLGTSTLNFNLDLVDAVDVQDMLDVCRCVITAALTREESRGPHFREEYRYTDNKNWLKYILLHSRDGKLDVQFEPVPLRYIKPDKERVDYLADPLA